MPAKLPIPVEYFVTKLTRKATFSRTRNLLLCLCALLLWDTNWHRHLLSFVQVSLGFSGCWARTQMQTHNVALKIVVIVKNAQAGSALLAVLAEAVYLLSVFLSESVEFLDVQTQVVLIVAFVE